MQLVWKSRLHGILEDVFGYKPALCKHAVQLIFIRRRKHLQYNEGKFSFMNLLLLLMIIFQMFWSLYYGRDCEETVSNLR